MLSHLRVACESAGQGFCPSKRMMWNFEKPDKVFQTEEEFCDDAGRDSRSGSTQWLGNMQPLWSPGSLPVGVLRNERSIDFEQMSQRKTTETKTWGPDLLCKWQFSLGQLIQLKKTDMFVGLWGSRWWNSYNWVDGTSRTVDFFGTGNNDSWLGVANMGVPSRTWVLVIWFQTEKTAPKTHDFMEVLQRALAILHSEVIKDDCWASRCY